LWWRRKAVWIVAAKGQFGASFRDVPA